MKTFAAVLSLLLCSGLCVSARQSPTAYVDPFIGTGGHGHTFPGATAPFGMVQLSPDTRLTGRDGCSGYHYSDDIIYGFSSSSLLTSIAAGYIVRLSSQLADGHHPVGLTTQG